MDSTETAPRTGTEEPEAPVAPEDPRWYQRAVPVTALVLALVALAALLLPGFRDQVRLSTSRQAQHFVELYFSPTPSGRQAVCARRGAVVRVPFTVSSHLGKRRRIAYRVSVTPASKATRTKRGSVQVRPGGTVEVGKLFVVPRGRSFTVSVSLPSVGGQLHAGCTGRGR